MNSSRTRLSDAAAKWVVPLAAGLIALIVFTLVYRRLHPAYPKAIVSQAAELEMPPWQWMDAKEATRHAASDTFSDADWQLTRKMCASSNKYQQTIGMSNVALLNKTKYRAEAITIARSGAASEDPDLKLMSIGALLHLGDPGWRDLAAACLNSPDRTLRQGAQSMLDHQPASN